MSDLPVDAQSQAQIGHDYIRRTYVLSARDAYVTWSERTPGWYSEDKKERDDV